MTVLHLNIAQDFLTTVRTDMFLRDILHLTICMSNTALEQTTLALLTPPPAQQRGDEGVAMETKPPPKKGRQVLREVLLSFAKGRGICKWRFLSASQLVCSSVIQSVHLSQNFESGGGYQIYKSVCFLCIWAG